MRACASGCAAVDCELVFKYKFSRSSAQQDDEFDKPPVNQRPPYWESQLKMTN